jgi:transcriptional regulator with XRE-family HTH domain
MAPSDLGLRIRRARERKRWDQPRLAAELGVSVRSVSRWENGTPPRSSIGALEDVLGVSLSDDGADPREQELREQLQAMDWLTPAEREQWVKLARSRWQAGHLTERAS